MITALRPRYRWRAAQRDGAKADPQHEEPQRIMFVFRFLPQTEGAPRGDGANVRLYECNGVFSEILPSYGFD